MPSGIPIIIMRRIYPKFTPDELSNLINQYFVHIKGIYRKKRRSSKGSSKYTYEKVYDPLPQPATFTGLALYLGFASLQDFDDYQPKGKLLQVVKQGRLRVEAEYEKRLHEHYTSGPIFALKSRGWNGDKVPEQQNSGSMNININQSGPKLASAEKEVII